MSSKLRNLYGYVLNDPVNSFDLAGQSGEPINRSGTTDMSGRNGRTGAPIEKTQRPPPSNYEKIADSIIKEFFKNLATAITSVPLNLLGRKSPYLMLVTPGNLAECQSIDCDGDGYKDYEKSCPVGSGWINQGDLSL